jgi:hypothetical protein
MIHLIIQSILVIIHYYFTKFINLFCGCFTLEEFNNKYGGGYHKKHFTKKPYQYDVIADEDSFSHVPYMENEKYIEEPPFVAEDKQEYLERDYRPIIFSRFPFFNEKSVMPLWNMPFYEANKKIKSAIINGENIHWTNQTLSYMRNRKSYLQMLAILKKNDVDFTNVVDATANIGGDSIGFACEGAKVKSYEIIPSVYNILVNNINLYKLDIEAKNSRFDYDIKEGSVVIIDPPFEKGNNAENFNLSIDNMPICAVCDKLLYGKLPNGNASHVLLTMPRDYKYNIRYANEHSQSVKAYKSEKNVKFFLVSKIL